MPNITMAEHIISGCTREHYAPFKRMEALPDVLEGFLEELFREKSKM